MKASTATASVKTLGCDLGDKKSALCALDPSGRVLFQTEVKTTREEVRRYFSGIEKTEVVMEVGTHSAWVSALVKSLGHKVTVINPHEFKLLTESRRKSDEADAQLLAKVHQADLKLVKSVRHREEATRLQLASLRTRDSLVKTRTQLISTVRGMLKTFGARAGACDAKVFHKRVPAFIPDCSRPRSTSRSAHARCPARSRRAGQRQTSAMPRRKSMKRPSRGCCGSFAAH